MNFTNSDLIGLATLITSTITAICALFLALASLKHSAKPKVVATLKNTKQLECSTLQQLEFILTNVGHWYGGPPAMDVITFINFAPEFELIRMKYGSNLERTYSKERLSPNGMKYFKAKGMKLSVGELGERIMVEIKTPDKCGNYDIRLSAMSANGVDCKKEFVIKCISIDVSSSSKD